MDRLVLALAALSLVTLLPAPAEAHAVACAWNDPVCLVECRLGHLGTPPPHSCAVTVPPDPLAFEACDAHETGVVAVVFGTPVDACVGPYVLIEPCPEPRRGVIVHTQVTSSIEACLG